jgi:hypothetical protein
MIDLDKYKGHTEGPWRVVAKANDYRTTDVVVGKTIVATNISGNDSSLIADSPLLLEEVKRLRSVLENTFSVLEYAFEDCKCLDLHAEVKQLTEFREKYMELKEAIVGQSIAPATGEQIIDRCINLTHEELIEEVLGYSPRI